MASGRSQAGSLTVDMHRNEETGQPSTVALFAHRYQLIVVIGATEDARGPTG